MLSILTLEKAGATDTKEMFTSSPEGESMSELLDTFLQHRADWTTISWSEEVVVLRDGNGDYWLAQSTIFGHHCTVETL